MTTRSFAASALLVLLLVVGVPSAALACVLSNQASLSANGYTAIKQLGALPGAPFLFQRVYGQGQAIAFSENLSDLAKSLTPAELHRPFLWRWGDGTYSIARTPSHTYRHTGTYMILVYTDRPLASDGSWAPFDRVQITIVPAAEVWRDNLGQDALDLFSFGFTWGLRLIVSLGVLVVAYGFYEDWRRNRRKRAPVRGAAMHGTEAGRT